MQWLMRPSFRLCFCFQVLILFNSSSSFLTPWKVSQISPSILSTRSNSLTKVRNEKPWLSLLRSQLSASDVERQSAMKRTMSPILQNVGLFPNGRADFKNFVVAENDAGSLRIESWGDDLSQNQNASDDRTLFLWLPGLDGTSYTGKDSYANAMISR
jgi:hypothetical protein